MPFNLIRQIAGGGGYFRHKDGGSRFCVPGPESSTTDAKPFPYQELAQVQSSPTAQDPSIGNGTVGRDVHGGGMPTMPIVNTAPVLPKTPTDLLHRCPTTPPASAAIAPTTPGPIFGIGNGTMNGPRIGNGNGNGMFGIGNGGTFGNGNGNGMFGNGRTFGNGTFGNDSFTLGNGPHAMPTAMCPGTPNAAKPQQPSMPPPPHLFGNGVPFWPKAPMMHPPPQQGAPLGKAPFQGAMQFVGYCPC